MDWTNVDLENDFEINKELVDSMTFKDFLLIISCGVSDINEESIQRAFDNRLAEIAEEARDIFESNKKNIIKKAKKNRAEK